MTRTIQHHERRHGGRADTTGTVVLRFRELDLRGRVVDLGARGIRVALAANDDRVVAGARVELSVRLDGTHTRWLRMVGRVRRIEDDGAVAIEFRIVPPDLEDIVQRELVAGLERDRVPAVIVVDPDASRRGQVAAAFRAAGCRVQESAAALDVVHALDDSRAHAWLVAIADTSPIGIADDLRAHLKLEYPRIPQIAIGARRGALAATRLSVDRRPDLAMQVHDLVGARDHAG